MDTFHILNAKFLRSRSRETYIVVILLQYGSEKSVLFLELQAAFSMENIHIE